MWRQCTWPQKFFRVWLRWVKFSKNRQNWQNSCLLCLPTKELLFWRLLFAFFSSLFLDVQTESIPEDCQSVRKMNRLKLSTTSTSYLIHPKGPFLLVINKYRSGLRVWDSGIITRNDIILWYFFSDRNMMRGFLQFLRIEISQKNQSLSRLLPNFNIVQLYILPIYIRVSCFKWHQRMEMPNREESRKIHLLLLLLPVRSYGIHVSQLSHWHPYHFRSRCEQPTSWWSGSSHSQVRTHGRRVLRQHSHTTTHTERLQSFPYSIP